MNDVPVGLPLAAPWSLFVGQFGQSLVFSAIGFFILAALAYVFVGKLSWLEKTAKLSFYLGAISVLGTMACLVTLFVKDQFQYQYVFEHGSADTDLKYKIAGVWTAQQGSFLLWAVTSTLCAVFALRTTGMYRRWFTVVQSLFLGTLCGILAYDTPFNIVPIARAHGKVFVAQDGSGMTPSLQNYWVVIHPPTIFLGFGLLSITIAYGLAALLTGDYQDWVKRVRPYALFTTGILGLGIAMGGLWAYETQGWGGFWAWDPVENVSFVPWLLTVAFVHGLIVQATKGRWVRTNLLMAGLPFLTFVYGTYLTRSGLLDKVSVHSFATMDAHARGILKDFLLASTSLFALVYGLKIRQVPSSTAEESEPPASREGLYRFGVTLLSMVSVVIALGMSWPVIAAARGGEGSKVEEWLYHLVVVWFFIPIMVLMAAAPFASWKGEGWRALGTRLYSVFCISLGLAGVAQVILVSSPWGVFPEAGATVAAPFGYKISLPIWMLFLNFLCIFVLVANLWRIRDIVKRSPTGIGGFIAHAGIAVLMGGLILSRGYERKETIFIRKGSPASALGYTVAFKGRTGKSLYDRDSKVLLDVTTPSGEHIEARPGLYKYGSEDDPKDMVWPHVERFPSHDFYLALSPPQITVWGEPVKLLPGQTKDVDGLTVEYLKPTTEGQLGTMGVKFGAQVRLTAESADHDRHQYLASPSVQVTQDGLVPTIPEIGPDFRIAMMGGVDPSNRAVNLMLFFNPPIYPITVFYKPLTGLVWLGAGILTLGGMLSAYSRRVRLPKSIRETSPATISRPDATLPAPQS